MGRLNFRDLPEYSTESNTTSLRTTAPASVGSAAAPAGPWATLFRGQPLFRNPDRPRRVLVQPRPLAPLRDRHPCSARRETPPPGHLPAEVWSAAEARSPASGSEWDGRRAASSVPADASRVTASLRPTFFRHLVQRQSPLSARRFSRTSISTIRQPIAKVPPTWFRRRRQRAHVAPIGATDRPLKSSEKRVTVLWCTVSLRPAVG